MMLFPPWLLLKILFLQRVLRVIYHFLQIRIKLYRVYWQRPNVNSNLMVQLIPVRLRVLALIIPSELVVLVDLILHLVVEFSMIKNRLKLF